ncbi:heparan-alpha-glucosaminide N-acetyltransferase domain-containing protein [Pedobacter sp. MC2016-15]|uniref:DUF1624 domain-containing protein n=1 Tax=Pedobacter sp. MC2016-15 TaxID=2994473 RepID=UPI002245D3BE|nr:heparan-alpha-glucosaminide N-acetyltransferase domain-containing protein [Pedobacter sp. MC2016-15]MCX2481437.1 heparan-alpha-glucosaminide N-acetyltransferase domain-containing protein [Pedobacter sp. MC2016-15]
MEKTTRIQSIDILRGLVMIIMALDHTRDFFHISAASADPLNPATTHAGLYFTRWITHFCAPIFIFLSGISVFLSSQQKDSSQASIFMIKRGLWLIFAEIIIMTFALTFNPVYSFIFLLVFWSIGWSMILLGIFSKISGKVVTVLGMLIVFGHNLLDFADLPQTGTPAFLIKIFFTGAATILPLSPTHLIGFFYAVLPWTGMMFLGYAAGTWYQKDFSEITRRKYLIRSGLALCLIFIILRTINVYGDPAPHQEYPTFIQNVFSFMNLSKYPPSLLFFCMTIGPALLILAALENVSNKVTRVIAVYGNVPFFYYVAHFYYLHLLLAVAFFLSGYQVKDIIQSPIFFKPAGFGFQLPVVYAIWLFVVASLYLPCLWFKRYKTKHNQWWLKYI